MKKTKPTTEALGLARVRGGAPVTSSPVRFEPVPLPWRPIYEPEPAPWTPVVVIGH